MKAIIISESELRSLLDQLELTKMKESGLYRNADTTVGRAIEEAHRKFHYVVCQWIQDVGGSPVR